MSWNDCETPESSNNQDCDVIEQVLVSREKDLGEFSVKRALPAKERKLVGPFIFLDQMGPAVFSEGQAMDVRPHPHIGISTITWLFEGEIQHKDSLGYDLTIKPGEVNWMTAGSGIVHSERSPQSSRKGNAPLFGIQGWMALPLEMEEVEPSFNHYSSKDIPHINNNDVQIALIAGKAWGLESPVQVYSDTLYAEINIGKDRNFELPDEVEERGIYIVQGQIAIAGKTFDEGMLVIFKPGSKVVLETNLQSKLMLLGGAKLDGERYLFWNFVSSSKDRIEQAKSDWQQGRFEKVEGDDEFIPLPSNK